MTRQPAIVLAHHAYCTPNGKAAHGLVRGGDRYRVVAVVDPAASGGDAGELLDGRRRDIPVVGSTADAVRIGSPAPEVAVVGVATHGGRLTAELRAVILEAVRAGLSVVNGLHDLVSDDPDIVAEAEARGLALVDLRRPPPPSELHFWTGAIREVRAPRLAVLGTDCALGKRTTTRLVIEALEAAGVRTEMIYTGQTGWMQGARYGIVLDALINDYVSGELERAIVACDREARPEVMVIEGQSSLRNPSGPCGAEFLVSGGARGVVLQHAPARRYFEGYEDDRLEIPPLEEEIDLVRLYGARTVGIAVNGEHMTPEEIRAAKKDLADRFAVPVVAPLEDGAEPLVPALRRFMAEEVGA